MKAQKPIKSIHFKSYFTFLIMLFFSFSLQAQDKKAKELLDQVTAKIKTYNNIVIDFKYSLSNTKENIIKKAKAM